MRLSLHARRCLDMGGCVCREGCSCAIIADTARPDLACSGALPHCRPVGCPQVRVRLGAPRGGARAGLCVRASTRGGPAASAQDAFLLAAGIKCRYNACAVCPLAPSAWTCRQGDSLSLWAGGADAWTTWRIEAAPSPAPGSGASPLVVTLKASRGRAGWRTLPYSAARGCCTRDSGMPGRSQ